ncbi:MAG: hypothetical protein COA79_17215 [Planctomycetota bacterium]|nr:MAG: hypothetical protein COA79_17215 [Planctomycetota bacterium]
MKQVRQTHFDSIRGIAALIVVFNHFLAAFFPYAIFGVQSQYIQRSSWEDIFFYPPFGGLVAGQFAVCLFFILSGYVLSYGFLGGQGHARKIIANIFKRPIRLGGLVLFTVLISSLFWWGGWFLNNEVSVHSTSIPWYSRYWKGAFEFKELLINLSTSLFYHGAKYNPPLWTIRVELYGSILVYLFVFFFGNFRFRLFFLFIALIFLFDSLFLGFVFGVIIADLVKNHPFFIKVLSNKKLLIALIPLLLFFVSFPFSVSGDFLKETVYGLLPVDQIAGGYLYPLIGALLLFLLILGSTKIQSILNHKYLKFLGEISYALYVIHFLVLGTFSSGLFLFLYSYMPYDLAFIITFLISIPLIVLLSYLATKYVDGPTIKLSSYIGTKIRGGDNYKKGG